MEETILSLPPETIAALEAIAKQTGRSRDELIQTAVQDFILQNRQSQSIGMGNSDRTDLSQRDEELLYQTSQAENFPASDPLIGLFAGSPDLATQSEEILHQDLTSQG